MDGRFVVEALEDVVEDVVTVKQMNASKLSVLLHLVQSCFDGYLLVSHYHLRLTFKGSKKAAKDFKVGLFGG